MSDNKYAFVEHSSAINSIINKTFEITQRIKFTAFDVSSKYIIFGANSGGIYIFYRDPCQFFKLIPSTHGPSTLIQTSPNEDSLAIAINNGFVIVLEGFNNQQFEQHLFIEHESQTVTALKWNGNDLYCGDSTGRVSVITFKSFLSKAIFQPPVACLMHLDSEIVQLDTFSKYLLVSTKTRTLLCDTESERFRQIGKKTRDGYFGACFLNSSIAPTSNLNHIWGVFTTINEDEQLATFETDAKIYCARPGIRLWQADFQGNVVLTHQFKSSMPQTENKIIFWSDRDKLKTRLEVAASWDNFSFNRIFPILDKFILTFTNDGFYIFEPTISALMFWNNLKNIRNIKVVNSILYVWHNEMEVAVFSLMTVEELILRSLMKKKYNLCGDLCVEFFSEVENLISTSKKIHLLSALEDKLKSDEVLQKLTPIFDKLKELAKRPILEVAKNGIVTVNAFSVLPETVENFEIVDKNKEAISILLEQYKINKIEKNIETIDFQELVKSLTTQDFYELISKLRETEENCDDWCKEVFLKNFLFSNASPEVMQFASTAFFEINKNLDYICTCGFPLPVAHQYTPKYDERGKELMETDLDLFLRKVPYLYKFLLNSLDSKDLQLKISLIVQFSDCELLETHSEKITYDLWDESIRLLLKLKSGQCLNCGSKIDPSASFNWTDFSILMAQSIKPTNTIKLLKRYSHLLPNGNLNEFFYQYCIFATVTNSNNAKCFSNNEEIKQQFETAVGGFLRKKYLRGSDFDSINKLENCDHCQLPLKTPILDDVKKLSCGHNYHHLCHLSLKRVCSHCGPVLLLEK